MLQSQKSVEYIKLCVRASVCTYAYYARVATKTKMLFLWFRRVTIS